MRLEHPLPHLLVFLQLGQLDGLRLESLHLASGSMVFGALKRSSTLAIACSHDPLGVGGASQGNAFFSISISICSAQFWRPRSSRIPEQRVLLFDLRGAAVGARADLFGVRQRQFGAVAEKSGLLVGGQLHRLDLAENELLGADADAVAVLQAYAAGGSVGR